MLDMKFKVCQPVWKLKKLRFMKKTYHDKKITAVLVDPVPLALFWQVAVFECVPSIQFTDQPCPLQTA